MKDEFLVETYLCSPETLTKTMNKHYENGYHPKEIQIKEYVGRVEGVIIYELKR